MTVSRRKGAAGKADLLFSRIVRSRARCARCNNTYGPFDTAHIVRRRYSATRCVEDNAWCLCRGCHRTVDGDPAEFIGLVDSTIGRGRYDELRRLANGGRPGVSSAAFWQSELVRLTGRCVELGISTKWKAA